MPALERARENARRAQCMANMHNVYLGFQFYADAYSEWYPGFILWGNHDMYNSRAWNCGYIAWANQIQVEMMKYVNGRLFLCPSATFGPSSPIAWMTNNGVPNGYWSQTSYWLMCSFGNHPCCALPAPTCYPSPPSNYGCPYSNDRHIVLRSQMLNRTSRSVMFMDRGWWKGDGKNYWYGNVGKKSNHELVGPAGYISAWGVQAADGANALLASGPVVWMDYASTVYNYRHDYYQNFYVDSFVMNGN